MNDIYQETELVYMQMQLMNARIRLEGMIAENKQREINGESLAYTEKNMVDLIEEFGIHHNAFPFYKG